MLLVAKERDTFLERLYELRPIARGLSPEGHCNFLMSDELPHETENTVYRYLIAISKLRLGILTWRDAVAIWRGQVTVPDGPPDRPPDAARNATGEATGAT